MDGTDGARPCTYGAGLRTWGSSSNTACRQAARYSRRRNASSQRGAAADIPAQQATCLLVLSLCAERCALAGSRSEC